jgi:rhodanese-related sulfurtransferase
MSEVEEVDVRTALKEMNEGAFLLDVREDNEFEAGHADGAVSIPLSELALRLEDVPTDREIYVICRSGARSAQAAGALREAGFLTTNVKGGSLEWRAEGLPFVSENDNEPTVL